MNEPIEKLESGDFVVTTANTNTPEYVITGTENAPTYVDTSVADRRRDLALKLAVLKQLMAQRAERTEANKRLAKKKAKNRAKNRVAKASRKRNRGR